MRNHNAVIKWKHFPHYWPFARGIHRSPEDSPHKDQWHGALIFSVICPWTNGGANNRDAGGLRHHHAHYDITVMNSVYLSHSWKFIEMRILCFRKWIQLHMVECSSWACCMNLLDSPRWGNSLECVMRNGRPLLGTCRLAQTGCRSKLQVENEWDPDTTQITVKSPI